VRPRSVCSTFIEGDRGNDVIRQTATAADPALRVTTSSNCAPAAAVMRQTRLPQLARPPASRSKRTSKFHRGTGLRAKEPQTDGERAEISAAVSAMIATRRVASAQTGYCHLTTVAGTLVPTESRIMPIGAAIANAKGTTKEKEPANIGTRSDMIRKVLQRVAAALFAQFPYVGRRFWPLGPLASSFARATVISPLNCRESSRPTIWDVE
jgi:hypothetical protein